MTLQEAKERVKIADLWREFGYEGEPRKTCFCPFHENVRTPALSIFNDGKAWKCHAGCGEGSVIDFLILAKGLDEDVACKEILRRAGASPQNPHFSREERLPDRTEEEKAKKRQEWPIFESPTQKEITAIAELRGLSKEGISLAAEAGLLWCADFREGRAWIITDSRRRNAQGRLLSGEPWWSSNPEPTKAKTLHGSYAKWPIGLREASSLSAIVIVEGGPDLLAAFHLAWCAGVESQIAPVAVLGAGIEIPDDALPHFAGRRVRIFPDNDKKGQDAKERWAAQLLAAGADVDSYSFAGLLRVDGAPVKDLCDFAHVHPDQWEQEREAIDQAFAFTPRT